MKVALGLKAHSGWAALVGLGLKNNDFVVVERRRIELADEDWQKQPYHAAEELNAPEARELVKRGISDARRSADREIRSIIRRHRELGNEITACAVLVGTPMPNWSTEEILAVHFRMHKAEGVLFRDVLLRGAKASGLKVLSIPEGSLSQYAEKSLGLSTKSIELILKDLGKSAGPPWARDQKDAALASMIALTGRPV